MRIASRITLLVVCCTLVAASARASETVSGVFTANRACDAYKSFAKGTNPGLIKTAPGEDYEAVEINNKDMDWIRIMSPSAPRGPSTLPARRKV